MGEDPDAWVDYERPSPLYGYCQCDHCKAWRQEQDARDPGGIGGDDDSVLPPGSVFSGGSR